jgi:hypothetical protein
MFCQIIFYSAVIERPLQYRHDISSALRFITIIAELVTQQTTTALYNQKLVMLALYEVFVA